MLKSFGKQPDADRWQVIKSSPNFNGRKFVNPVPTSMSANPFRIAREYWKSDPLRRKPKHEVPVQLWGKSLLEAAPSTDLHITWLGHASAIIEIDGLRLLADPVFCKRVSPIPGLGPVRMHDTPFPLDLLPAIDAVLISHNHYDHLDQSVVEHLIPSDTVFIAPLAVGSTLRYWGIPADRITELDWHDEVEIGKVTVTATPARHFTGRGVLDRNRSLWASYTIKGSSGKVFFCGDSGFFEGFGDIGEAYGPFDVTMIGIGAYNKDWQAIHTNPEEAVRAHALLKGRYLLPIHWCTFDLALHDWSEPVERLLQAAEEAGVDLWLPKPGERLSLQTPVAPARWW